MKPILAVTLGLLIAGASGLLHGRIIDRWGLPADVARVAQHVETMTLPVAGWKAQPGEKIGDHTRKLAGAEGYFASLYTHEQSGVNVQVTMVCGRPGPISLHTPEYCFVLSGMKPLDKTKSSELEDPESDVKLRTADYRPPESKPGPDIRTFWSWSADAKKWSTPENPRFEFASTSHLYKVYFTSPTAVFDPPPEDPEAKSQSEAIVRQFMADFLARFSESVAALES